MTNSQVSSVPIKSGTLDEVDGLAIQQYIDQDPRELSDDQLNQIIAYARANRIAWQAEENNPSGAGGGKKRKIKITLDELSSLDLNLEL